MLLLLKSLCPGVNQVKVTHSKTLLVLCTRNKSLSSASMTYGYLQVSLALLGDGCTRIEPVTQRNIT